MPRKKKQSSIGPVVLISAGAVLLIAVLIWVAVSSNGGKAASVSNQDIPYANVPRISLADAKAAYDQKSALFLDVRDGDSYAASHIPGAVNIPLTTLESRVSELKPDQWIITYCT